MRIQSLFFSLFLALILGVSAPAHAAPDTSVVVARMDVIIKQMEALKLEFATLAASLGSTPTPVVLGASNSKPVFTMSLEVGETNDDIKRIQKLLATDPEIYPYGVASGFYGPKTEEGIKNFQTRFNLDPVGVVGPATKALLELFMNAYPTGEYPTDVLKKKPQVQGASTSVPTPTTPVVSTGTGVESIIARYDGEEASVRVGYTNGSFKAFLVEGDTKIAVTDVIASKIGATRAEVLGLIEFTGSSNDDEDDEDEDEDDEDFNIDVEIDGDEVTVSFEFDGDDYEAQSNSTDEDDVLDEVADELNEDLEDVDEDLLDAISDALDDALDEEEDEDENNSEIESIRATVKDGETGIRVRFEDEDEDDENFTVDEDDEDDIIAEVADELNIDEDEVEDLIEFEYGDIDSILVTIEEGRARVVVEYEEGAVKKLVVESDDEDDIIEEIADELGEDEDDIEELAEFDYAD